MDSEEQVALLRGLLSHYSPTLSELPAVLYLAGWMQEHGFEVTVDEAGSIIGSLGDGPREILMLGHIDTVPGVVPVRTVDGKLYGRGAVDAKGALACFTSAVLLTGARPGWKFTVIGAVGEEGDSRGAKFIRDRMHPDFCVIGEPSGWDHVTLGYKGSAWYSYTIQRPLGHTAGQAESACETAVAFWNDLQTKLTRINANRHRAFDQLTSYLRSINSIDDGLIQTVQLKFNLRLPLDINLNQADDFLHGALEECSMVRTDGIECFRAEKNTPLVRAFLSAIRQEAGKPGFLVKTGSSDMNIVGPFWNLPILAYGPGDSALDHTPEEHILLEEYLSAIRIIRRVLDILSA